MFGPERLLEQAKRLANTPVDAVTGAGPIVPTAGNKKKSEIRLPSVYGQPLPFDLSLSPVDQPYDSTCHRCRMLRSWRRSGPRCEPADATKLAIAPTCRCALSKNHAAPQPRVPAESPGANDWCRCHDHRCPRYNDDRAFVRTASSVRPGVKTRTAAACGASAVEGDE